MRSHNRLDSAVFIAILTAGVVLLLLGVPTNSLATVCVALSGLYGAWTGNRPAPRPPDGDEPSTAPPTHHDLP